MYFLETALSVSLNKYICGRVLISIASSSGFYRQYNYCVFPKNRILSSAKPGSYRGSGESNGPKSSTYSLYVCVCIDRERDRSINLLGWLKRKELLAVKLSVLQFIAPLLILERPYNSAVPAIKF